MWKLRSRLFDEQNEGNSGGGQGSLFENGKQAATPPDQSAKIAELEAKIAQSGQSMEQRLAQMQQQLQAGRPAVAPTGGDDQKINEQLWDMLYRDPKQLLTAQQAITRQTLQQYDAMQRQQRFPADKAAARNEVKEEFPEVFKTRGADVEKFIADNWPGNPEAFRSPEAWRMAARVVKGEHAEEFMKGREADPGAPGKPSPKPLASSKDKDEALSEAEDYAADNVFGIDKKEYAKHKKIVAAENNKRDTSTWQGRGILKSSLARSYYKDMDRTRGGFANPNYGKWVPLMTFDSSAQKPRAEKPPGAIEV